MLRAIGILVVIALLGFAGLYVAAGRGAPPQITIAKPERVVGQAVGEQMTMNGQGNGDV